MWSDRGIQDHCRIFRKGAVLLAGCLAVWLSGLSGCLLLLLLLSIGRKGIAIGVATLTRIDEVEFGSSPELFVVPRPLCHFYCVCPACHPLTRLFCLTVRYLCTYPKVHTSLYPSPTAVRCDDLCSGRKTGQAKRWLLASWR